MCGRVNTYNKESIYDIMRMFTDDVSGLDHFDTRYNVSPGARLPALYRSDGAHALAMHWGLVPLWAKPGTFSRPLINARAETVFDKPSFRSLVKQQRCVVAVNGFYEWQRSGDDKLPYYFTSNEGVVLLGGLYQFNKQDEAEVVLITTAANAVMTPVHDRMPMIVEREAVDDWLGSEQRTLLEDLMAPAPETALTAQPVSTYVNRSDHDGPRCIEAV